MANHVEFTAAKLYDYNGDVLKRWFVGFTFLGKRYQVRMGLNFIKNRKERLSLGKDICLIVDAALHDGWNPSTLSIDKYLAAESEARKSGDINQKNLLEAIDFGLEKGSWSHKTKLCYTSTAKFYKGAAKALSLDYLPIQDITKQHIMLMTDQIKKDRKWSNKSVNKNVIYLSAILKVVKDYDIIPHNPAHDIRRLPETESEKYHPYTQAEKKIIHDALYGDHFRFYVIFMITYHTGIRPHEVLALKISDIHMPENEIVIIPNQNADNSKNKKIRHVPINPHLKQLLLNLELDKSPSNYYVFGSPYAKGKNHIKGHKRFPGTTHPDYYKPSPNRVPRNYITQQWRDLIWEGKGIHKYMYAAKHTGGDDKLLAGVDLTALRDMYGHYSTQMTEKYLSKLKQVHKKVIIENSPDFL